MDISNSIPHAVRERHLRMASWRGLRARGWWRRRPRGYRHRDTVTEAQPVPDTLMFRRCGNVSDMVRACVLVVSWYECPSKQISKAVLDWLHPASSVTHCERCFDNYLAVQRYFQAWVSSHMKAEPLPKSYDVPTLEGGEITEAELKRIVQWVCDHLGCELPSDGDEDSLPAA